MTDAIRASISAWRRHPFKVRKYDRGERRRTHDDGNRNDVDWPRTVLSGRRQTAGRTESYQPSSEEEIRVAPHPRRAACTAIKMATETLGRWTSPLSISLRRSRKAVRNQTDA